MKRLLFLLIALSTATYVWADDEDEERMNAEYARNQTLEVNFGPMWNLRSYNDAPSLAVGFMGNHILGGGIQIRYTSFLSRHWFFFLSGEYSSMKDDYSNKFYDHCSDRYEYMIDYINKEYIDFECFSFGDNIGHIYNQVLAGAIYRFDFGRHWLLRSRLGAGYRKLIAEPDYKLYPMGQEPDP